MLYTFKVAVPDTVKADGNAMEALLAMEIGIAEYMLCQIGGQPDDFILDTLDSDPSVSSELAHRLADAISVVTRFGVLHTPYKEESDEQETPPPV